MHAPIKTVLSFALAGALQAIAPAYAAQADAPAAAVATVQPGDDFFAYANADWLQSAQIPADRGSVFFEDAGSGRRKFELAGVRYVRSPVNKVLQYLGGLSAFCGVLALVLEWRMRRTSAVIANELKTFLAGATTMASTLAAVFMLTGAKEPPRHEHFDEITVGRINIVEPDGTKRMVPSGSTMLILPTVISSKCS
eukprot:gene34961-43110_t